MDRGTGRFWAAVVTALVAFATGAFGVLIGTLFEVEEPAGLGVAFAIAGVGIFYAAALYRGSVRPNEFIAVERMMRFWDVKFQGLHLMFPFIDRARERGDFFGKDVELFVDGSDPTKRIEIDFENGSAGVSASAWYQVGDPSGDREKIFNAVVKWAYTVLPEEREERITEVFEGALRPIFQAQTIDKATTGSLRASQDATDAAKDSLAMFGVYPMPSKGIVIRDIDLPTNIVAIRELEFEGQKRALQMKATSSGYWSSIQEIIDAAAKATPPIVLSADKAQEIFERQIALGVIRDAKANITFISPDIDGVVKTITVGSKGTNP